MTNALEARSHKMRGLNLATKLALAVAAVITVFMIVFGFVLGRSLESTVKQQLMTTAAETARAAARADLHAWTRHFGTPYQSLSEQEVANARAEFTVFEKNQYAALEPQLEWNARRFERFVDTDAHILAADLVTFDDQGNPTLLQASYEGALRFAPIRDAPAQEFGDAWAREGLLTTQDRVAHVIRGTAPILDPDGNKLAEISVCVEAVAIQEAAGKFTLEIAWAAMIFAVLGGAVAYGLGHAIARPVKLLQDDIRVVASGDFQHHTKPHSRDEIGELAHTFDQMTKSLAEAREVERRAQASRHEMAVAAEVVSLHPAELPVIPGFDADGLHAQHPELGDDYYDVLAMPGGRFGFLVASASGSGAPAAMVMAMARSFLRAVAEGEAEPDAVLRKVNALMTGDLRKGMYVSVLLAVLDPADGMVTVANAGHTPLHHWRADDGQLDAVHSEGIALGFDSGPVFDQTLKTVQLQLCKGDRVLMHGADLPNLPGADGQPLGEKRLHALLAREAPSPAGKVVSHARAVLRKFSGVDDPHVTLLTLGRPAR